MIDVIFSFFSAFAFIFIMELGDKTQLIIFTLSAKKLKPALLAAGAVAGFALIVFFGGVIAKVLEQFMSLDWLSLISGMIFILLGIFQMVSLIRDKETRDDGGDISGDMSKDEKKISRIKNSFMAGFIAILFMELGDKTQVATILLASTSSSIIATLLGSWAALSSLAIVGVFAGSWLARKVPRRVLDTIALILFIVIGLSMVIISVMNL
ncbi:MAG: TMEM165/GDT1 family protein [Promethearchaeota archaeon]